MKHYTCSGCRFNKVLHYLEPPSLYTKTRMVEGGSCVHPLMAFTGERYVYCHLCYDWENPMMERENYEPRPEV